MKSRTRKPQAKAPAPQKPSAPELPTYIVLGYPNLASRRILCRERIQAPTACEALLIAYRKWSAYTTPETGPIIHFATAQNESNSSDYRALLSRVWHASALKLKSLY